MNRKILLVEPAYKTKYPPLGLMKISTYHKQKGNHVRFVKGCNGQVTQEYWDKIYIATLFTWTWNETVKTILYYKDSLFRISGKIFVGGIVASLMPEELFNATGIYPVIGLLSTSKMIEEDDDVSIDLLPPDYKILEQIENNGFEYAYTDAYLGYSTRGCVHKCEFCAVKTFEPKYIPYIDIKSIVNNIKKSESGEKQNLLLMDNNVLASPKFDKIIDDIKEIGFFKGATYGKTKRKRIVDFNQGLDARFLTESKMKRLAEIPLEPMRIAFDDINLKKVYVNAVRLAHEFGQVNMSNYILYNYNDTPEDFYERLKINIDLNEEFRKNRNPNKTVIYSFPMRYIPLNAKERSINTGNKYWNKRYLRAIKVILNVTKGPVMPGEEFFTQAFGENYEHFRCILSMPDDFIRNRVKANWKKIKGEDKYKKRLMPYVANWEKIYFSLNKSEKDELINLIETDDLEYMRNEFLKISNTKVKELIRYHLEAKNIVNKYRKE